MGKHFVFGTLGGRGLSGAARAVCSRIIWNQNIGTDTRWARFALKTGFVIISPFMLSEADPDTDAGELVARDCGADDTRSSTMTSMSLLLSSASASGGKEPGWSSLLREI